MAVFVFLASLGTLAASTSIALWDSTDELAAGERLRNRVSKFADEARDAVATLPSDESGLVLPEADNRRLTAVATEVLPDYPSAEGGFYLAASEFREDLYYRLAVVPVHLPCPFWPSASSGTGNMGGPGYGSA